MSIHNNVVSGPPEVFIPAHLSYGKYCFEQLKTGGKDVAQVCSDTGRTTTYKDILQNSVNLAVALKNLGVRKGDVVSISSENRFEFTVASLAVMYIGGILSTVNITYSPEELLHTLKITKPKYIFCSPLSAQRLHVVTKDMPFVEKLILFGNDKLIPAIMYNDLVATYYDVRDFEPVDVNGTEDTFAIMTSSGTTGLPKGVMLTNINFLALTLHLKWYLEQSIIRKPHEVKVSTSVIPWFHAYGFITHFAMICMHIKNVFMVKFEEEKYLKAIQNYKVNLMFIVPPIAVFFAKHPSVAKYDLSSVNDIWCGAAPLSKEVQQAVSKRIGIDFIRQGFGFTEMTMACIVDLSSGKSGSCGQPSPGVQVKVKDIESGKALGPYQEGELCFKSVLRMKGYVDDKAATDALVDDDGFMRSGDVGFYDTDGSFYIIDRLKELIKYKGFQVAPAELEAILLQHSGVKECGVVGKADEDAGELPTAFVVRQPGATVSETELLNHVNVKVSPAKRLRGGIIFISDIPKNPSGKVVRRQLRQMLNNNTKSKL